MLSRRGGAVLRLRIVSHGGQLVRGLKFGSAPGLAPSSGVRSSSMPATVAAAYHPSERYDPDHPERGGASDAGRATVARRIVGSAGSASPTPLGMGRAASAEWKRQRLSVRRDLAVERAVALVMRGDVTGVASYNAAMEGCRRFGRHSQTLLLWEQMSAAQVAPDRMAYQHAMVSAMRLRRYALAYDIWLRLDADPGTSPTAFEYTVAMSVSERAAQPERALRLLDRMQAAGVSVGPEAYEAAILSCAQLGLGPRADELLQRLEAAGPRPTTELYHATLRACALASEGGLASQLVGRMRRLGVPRDTETYRIAITACAEGGEETRPRLLATVDMLLQEPTDCLRRCLADVSLCKTSISACADAGHWRATLAILAAVRPEAARQGQHQLLKGAVEAQAAAAVSTEQLGTHAGGHRGPDRACRCFDIDYWTESEC